MRIGILADIHDAVAPLEVSLSLAPTAGGENEREFTRAPYR